MAHRDPFGFCSARHQRFELLDQLLPQSIVVGQLSKGQRAIPCSDFRVVNRRAVLVRAGDEVLRNPLANFLRRAPAGQLLK